MWFRIIFFAFSCLLIMGCQTTRQTDDSKNTINLHNAANINIRLGMNYLRDGQIIRAKQKILLALNQAPDLPQTQMAMGYFLMKEGEQSLAEKFYQKAIKLAPTSSQVQNNYGVFLCHLGRYSEANEHFKIAAQDVNYLSSAMASKNARLCSLKKEDKDL